MLAVRLLVLHLFDRLGLLLLLNFLRRLNRRLGLLALGLLRRPDRNLVQNAKKNCEYKLKIQLRRNKTLKQEKRFKRNTFRQPFFPSSSTPSSPL